MSVEGEARHRPQSGPNRGRNGETMAARQRNELCLSADSGKDVSSPPPPVWSRDRLFLWCDPQKKAADRCNRRQEKEFLSAVSLDEDVLHGVSLAKYVTLFLKESHCYAIASLVKRIFLSIFDLFAMPSLSLSVSNLPDTVSPDRLLASFTLFLKKSLCRSL